MAGPVASNLSSAVRQQKRELRKTVNTVLRGLPSSSILEQSQVVADIVVSSPWFKRCRTVSCYLSMPTAELDTSRLVSSILSTGKTLFVPKIDTTADGHMEFLRVYDQEDLENLPSGIWGIKEPGPQWNGRKRASALDSTESLDLILVPGVAFDRNLQRLGHGKGYYDRFITSFRSHGAFPLLVGLGLQQQIMETIPVDDHDWKMDLIVTAEGAIGGEDRLEQKS